MLLAHDLPESDFLQTTFSDCERCFDIGWHVSPQGGISRCPVIAGTPGVHHPLSQPGERISRCIEAKLDSPVELDAYHFEVARTLAAATRERPMHRDELIRRHFSFVRGSENQRRKLTLAVNHLRSIWLLPVGSSKREPCGYWIITNESDFKNWIDWAAAEPVTKLNELRGLARFNFPIFARQLELRFEEAANA
ncbi:MAG: hypothetical protein IPM50_02765 [Acidobacteriota bacterium]|nr:MAG: hypothetical protein IPM50_02765 [Acidobacteriota bacterium]